MDNTIANLHMNAAIQPQTSSTRIEKAAAEFESFFTFQMLEHMSAGIKPPEVMGGGHAETIFKSMLNEKVAAEVTKAGGLGVAKVIEDQIKLYQEAQQR